MKKIISKVLALTMVMSLCAVMPAMAENSPYDTVNNTFSYDFSYDFNGASSTATRVNVAPVGETENYALQVATKQMWRKKFGDSNNTVRPTMVKGNDVVLNFKLMIDDTSTTNIETGLLFIRAGGENKGTNYSSTNMMQLKYNSAKASWDVHVSTGRSAYTETPLCSIIAGEWVAVSMVLHLSEDEYDVYINGNTLRNLAIGADAKANETYWTSGLSNLVEVQFQNSSTDSTYYIDDLYAYAGDELVMDFEDDSTAIGYGVSSGGATIETTTDALGQETKALALKYDGSSAYRKENSDSTLNSSWQLNKNNTTVSISGKEATIGFDFKIDSEGTAAGTYESRDNPGTPTFLHFYAPDANGSNKQTTMLVSAQYAGALGDDYAKGPKKWDLCFADGRKNWIKSGHQISADEWVSVDVAIHLETGTYDAYVNGVLTLENLSLGGITNSTTIPNTGNITNVNMYGTYDGNYSVDNYSKWKVYIDNFTYNTWSWTPITATDAKLLDSEDADAVAGSARKYTVTVNNPNKFTEKACFVLRAIDKNGIMQDIAFEEINLPKKGENPQITMTLDNLSDEEKYDVKAFVINLETLTPYSDIFATLSSPIE